MKIEKIHVSEGKNEKKCEIGRMILRGDAST